MTRRLSPAARAAVWTLGVVIALLFGLAAFPWGAFTGPASRMLSAATGRRVTIAAMRRLDLLSLTPRLELRDVRIAQPAWAGSGDMARIGTLRLRLPLLPLLIGRIRPRDLEADGAILHLVRDAGGRDTWSGEKKSSHRRSAGTVLEGLAVRDSTVRLDDAKRHVTLFGTLVSDRHGFHVETKGTLRGQPLALSVDGGPILAGGGRYPLDARIRSPLADIDARLVMDRPLDTRHFDARIAATGRDLTYVDDILQAGLFPTQHVRLAAEVRRDGSDWRIPKLDATIGRSRLSASLTVAKSDGRTRLTGKVDARTLDFDDLASDAQQAEAAAKRRAIGPRIVPDTRIVLARLDKLDGRLAVTVARLLSPGPFRSLSGTVTLERQRLTLGDLVVALPVGRAIGRATVDGNARPSRLSIDMRIEKATIDSFLPNQQAVAGPLDALVRLAGSGDSVRDALARSNGRIGVAISDGTVRKDYATFLSGDVLKSVGVAITGGSSSRMALQCLVGNFSVHAGRLTPAPLLLSTASARGDGTGAVILGPETVDLHILGSATRPGPLLSTAPVRAFGTLSDTRIDITPPRAESATKGGAVARIGFFLKGLKTRHDVKPATPVDCARERRTALD